MQEDKISFKQGFKISKTLIGVAINRRPYMVLLYMIGAIGEILATIGTLYASSRVAGLLAQFVSTGDAGNIWTWVWIDIGLAVLIGISFFAMQYSKRILYYTFTTWSVDKFTSALNKLDIGSFYDDKTRNLINKVGGGYTWQISNLANSTFDLIYGILRFLAITIVISQIAWWLVFLIFLFLIPTLISERKVAQLQWFIWDEKGDERHVFWGIEWLIRQVKAQMEMRSLQASKYVTGRLNDMNSKFYKRQENLYKKATDKLLLAKVFEVGGIAIGSIVLLRQVLARTISIERYFFLSGALLRVGGALNNVFGLLSSMQEPLLFANSFFTLTNIEPTIVDKPGAKSLNSTKAPVIEFQDVSFKYPGEDALVLENFSLKIPAGEHVALVGENGAGKSTIIKLLLRFYVPTSGKILVNGIDLQDIKINSWYSHVATLFQEFNRYPLTIEENVQVGRSEDKLNKKMLLEAAKASNLLEMVDKYRWGWDTVLDASFQKGIEPSGGQWQRVALGRSFYRNASVLILDEPTSAIDAKAEYDIFNDIFSRYAERTAIIVSHRFSTVRRASRIVVLDEGKIVEEGTHQTLMKKKEGIYHTLFNNQAEGYR